MTAAALLPYEELPSTTNTREAQVSCNIILIITILIVLGVVVAKIFL